MRISHLGSKVRRLRQAEGISQVEAATGLGISASYLNLIEHNQRRLTVSLLFKVGQFFDVDLRDWSEGDETRLASSIREVLGDPVLGDIEVPDGEISEAMVAAPNLSHALKELYAVYRHTLTNVHNLGDRLSEQNAISMASMEIRTVLTSIRSFSEILREHEDLDEERRQQFLSILVDESDRLSSMINSAAATADESRLQAPMGKRQPVEEVSRFLEHHDNYFSELEAAAESITEEWDGTAFEMPGHLGAILGKRFGVSVSFDTAVRPVENDILVIDPNRPVAEIIMELANHLGHLMCGDAIAESLESKTLPEATSNLLRKAMTRYFGAALIMPYGRFQAEAAASNYDLEHLARLYQVTPLMAAGRLTTLRRPGARGVPFHLIVVDIAGNVRERIPGSGMPLPRFGSSCPRWKVHQSFASPGHTLSELVELPDGSTYFCMSRSNDGLAFSLGCAESQAGHVKCFDELPSGERQRKSPVGVNCRICPRPACPDRAFDSLVGLPKNVIQPQAES